MVNLQATSWISIIQKLVFLLVIRWLDVSTYFIVYISQQEYILIYPKSDVYFSFSVIYETGNQAIIETSMCIEEFCFSVHPTFMSYFGFFFFNSLAMRIRDAKANHLVVLVKSDVKAKNSILTRNFHSPLISI